MLALHVVGAITTEQFKHKMNNLQQQELMVKKVDIIIALEKRSNLAEHKEAFRKEVERFKDLNIGDEQVLKQILQRLIQSIKVFESGKIKINYNLSTPLPSY